MVAGVAVGFLALLVHVPNFPAGKSPQEDAGVFLFVATTILDGGLPTATCGTTSHHSSITSMRWAFLAKRRPESVALPAALAARTMRVRLAVGCMASFPVRHPVLLAAQWATVDQVAGPDRMILAACIGGEGGGGDWQMENDAFGVPQGERIGRMVEGIQALKALWTQEHASFEGKYHRVSNVISEPRPVTKPFPAIWIAANPRPSAHADMKTNVDRATRRITKHAGGWMTTWLTPADFADRLALLMTSLRENGQDADAFDNTLYYNVNINEDREAAAAESKRFLDLYYGFDITRPRLDLWVAYGPPEEVITKIREFADAGATGVPRRRGGMRWPTRAARA